MLGIICGVGIMAGPAGPSLHSLVDMHKMQVPVPVPEAGQGSGLFVKHQGLFMAAKAQFVILHIKGRIEDRREVLPQYPEII